MSAQLIASEDRSNKHDVLPKDHPFYELSQQAARAYQAYYPPEKFPDLAPGTEQYNNRVMTITLIAANAEMDTIEKYSPGPRRYISDVNLSGTIDGKSVNVQGTGEIARLSTEQAREQLDQLAQSRNKHDGWHDQVKDKLPASLHELYDDAVRASRVVAQSHPELKLDERKASLSMFNEALDKGYTTIADARPGNPTQDGDRNLFFSQAARLADDPNPARLSMREIAASDPNKLLDEAVQTAKSKAPLEQDGFKFDNPNAASLYSKVSEEMRERGMFKGLSQEEQNLKALQLSAQISEKLPGIKASEIDSIGFARGGMSINTEDGKGNIVSNKLVPYADSHTWSAQDALAKLNANTQERAVQHSVDNPQVDAPKGPSR
jgi:hypothetical protein